MSVGKAKSEISSLFEFNDLRAYLRAELYTRKLKNSRYSLRSFAKALSVSSTHLSAVLAGKRFFSKERLVALAERLRLTGKEREYFMMLGELEITEHPRVKEEIQEKIKNFAPHLKSKALSYAEFQMIQNWKYFAVLAAMARKPSASELKGDLERALDLNSLELEVIRDRLRSLHLIRYHELEKRWEVTDQQVLVDGKKHKLSILRFHEEWLKWCEKNIREHHSETRFSASEWIALEEPSFLKAKEILSKALDDIYALTDKKAENTAVYGVCLHFLKVFPSLKK